MRHHADKKTSAIFAAASPFSAAVLASSDEKFPVKFKRANLGTAPRYRGGFSAPTIKSAKGWIAALLVDESPDVKNLPVAPKDETEFVENFPAFQIGFKSRANFPTSSHWEWKAQWRGILRRPLRTAHKDRRLRRVCAGRQARRHDPLRYAHRRRLREETAQNRQHKAARTLQTRHGNKSAQRLPARVSLKPPKPAGGTGSRRSYPSAAQRKQTYRRPPYGGSFFSYSPRANGRKKKIPPPPPKKNLRAKLKRHKRASPPTPKASAHNGETPRISNGAGIFHPKSARADSATRKHCMLNAATSRAADHLRKIRLSLRKRKRAEIAAMPRQSRKAYEN